MLFRSYPDRDAAELRIALADYLHEESGVDLTSDQVWAANGSNEIMLQILQTYGGPAHTALTFTPTYSMYEEYARDSSTDFVAVPRNDDFSLDAGLVREAIEQHSPHVIFFASPNNPTGTSMSLEIVETALVGAPNADRKSTRLNSSHT